MLFVYLCVVGFLGYVNYRLSRSVINPAFISCCVWFILPLTYNLLSYTNPIFRLLSGRFYIAILFYLVPFVLMVHCLANSRKRNSSLLSVPGRTSQKLHYLLVLSVTVTYYMIYRIFVFFGTTNIITIMAKMRIVTLENGLPADIKACSYFTSLANIVLIYSFLRNIKKMRYLRLLLLAGTCITTILWATKGAVFQLFFSFVIILYLKKKLKKKTLISLGLICLLFIMFITNNRDEAGSKVDVTEFLFIYIYSPMPALDLLLNHEVAWENDFFGGRFFAFFYRVVTRLNLGLPVPHYGSLWVNVPYMTNVFTIIGTPFMDFGYMGIIFIGLFYGSLYALLYKHGILHNKLDSKIIYVLYFYCLLFQFFGEWIISFLSVTIQCFVYCFFVTKRIRLYRRTVVAHD